MTSFTTYYAWTSECTAFGVTYVLETFNAYEYGNEINQSGLRKCCIF